MEDIAADDDLLSDMLLDSLEFEPKIATHKMNQIYRSPRYKTQDVIDIVRNRVVIGCDVGNAVEDLIRLDVIKKHLAGKSSRQIQEFQLHARRYLETYLPESGVEYALTTRYRQAALQGSPEAQTSKAGQAEAQARAEAQALQDAHQQIRVGSTKGKSRMLGENGIALGTTKADLCVVATKPFKVGDLILLCKGGVKDLTKSEDEALREEAAMDRERRKEQDYMGVLGAGRDFSVIRSARKGCSQLLLGPARFVNHDCDPNCEFHRLGPSQMVFKCLRNIGLNEEITTFYGENYFEWGNSECMCKTCEERGRGYFADLSPPQKGEEESDTTSIAGKEADRRSSLRKIPIKSPPPTRESPGPTIAMIKRNGKIIKKTFNHHVSQREFDATSTTRQGPKCTCLTCGTTFWAPEAWWEPDECRRCERHYRIFKADWPGRLPTEGGFSARAKVKRKEFEMKREDDAKKRKSLHAPSPGISSNSDTDTPVKLSPLRDAKDQAPVLPAPAKRARKKQRIVIEDGIDEEIIDASLQGKNSAKVKHAKGKRVTDDRVEEDSDLTSVSGSDEVTGAVKPRISSTSSESNSDSSSSSRPSGPKMLGKEAKTETLAMYWGAPSGDRRHRRQSHNGLESLAKNAKREIIKTSGLRKEHRRNISDVSMSSVTTKMIPPVMQQHMEVETPRTESTKGSPLETTTAIASPQGSSASARLTEEGFQSPMSFSLAEDPLREGFDSSRESPKMSMPGLATKGSERTSVKNLAMAWSAGVEEGGRGSRRRQARDLSQPLSTTSTPPMQPRRRVSSRTDRVVKSPASEKDVEMKNDEVPLEDIHTVELPKSTLPDSMRKESPSSSFVRTISNGEEAVKRHSSPFANQPPPPPPPAVVFGNRPGVVPGQPIRKNLRWGSGKTSVSRPFIGPNAPSASPVGHSSLSESNVPRVSTSESPRSASYHQPPSASPTPLHQSADGPFHKINLMETKTSDQLQNILHHQERINGKTGQIKDENRHAHSPLQSNDHRSLPSNLMPSLQDSTTISKPAMDLHNPPLMSSDASNGHTHGS